MDTFIILEGTTPMHRKRMEKHRVDVAGNGTGLFIIDNLENGAIKIYETIDCSLPICMSDFRKNNGTPENTRLVADAVINVGSREEGVFIYKVSCIQGYETMIEPLIYQILHFADFYGHESVEILDREYDRWFHFAKEALAGFKRIGRVYECRIDK